MGGSPSCVATRAWVAERLQIGEANGCPAGGWLVLRMRRGGSAERVQSGDGKGDG